MLKNRRYNSLIFPVIGAHSYYWAIVAPGHTRGSPVQIDPSYYTNIGYNATDPTFWENVTHAAAAWERLENKECIEAYSNSFLWNRRNVLLYTSYAQNTTEVLAYGAANLSTGFGQEDNYWICSRNIQDDGVFSCDPHEFVKKADSWTVYEHRIAYCLSERIDSNCSLLFNGTYMKVLLAINALKICSMIWILHRFDTEKLLTCTGDAIVSFIGRADLTTVCMCLSDRRTVSAHWRRPLAREFPVARRRLRLGRAISKTR